MRQGNFSEIYQKTVLHLNKNPLNYRRMENPCREGYGQNKVCGDYLHVYIQCSPSKENPLYIKDVSFEGEGCAILKASASLMTEILKGKTFAEVDAIIHSFEQLVLGKIALDETLGELNIFSGIGAFQSRISCAQLPWEALSQALREYAR